jgi:FADH2 O2-dependent halogenase
MTNARSGSADVVVLGSGLAGSIAAWCLARKGLSVLLVDQGTHPRFALGESTTTPSSLWLRVLAERFGMPELLEIASAEAITRSVAPTSGVKNNFGFLYHRAGAARPERCWQAVIPQAFLGDAGPGGSTGRNEMHYFRQDVDAWLWQSALAEGAIGRPDTSVTGIEFGGDGAVLTTAGGETLRARFVVDASGYRSPIADRLGLRQRPPRMRTNSRTLFTHMIGVLHYEALELAPLSMARWSQGTLHHCFDGGWIWVIPFDNHPASTNRLCSVGLNLDNRRFPKPQGVSAQEEWDAFLEGYPAIARQFERAVAVRPWIHTDRVQYSSSSCVGDRFWLTSHAAGAVDALYSMGNVNTFHSLAAGLDAVLGMFGDGRFDRERLQPVQQLTDNLLRLQDRIVYGNYVGFRAPELLQTWIALWSLTDTARIRQVLAPLVRYVRTRDPRELDDCVRQPATMLTGIGMHTGCADAATVLADLDALCDIMQELEEGRSTVAATAARLQAAVQARPQYAIDLAYMEKAFAVLPLVYEPLSRNGLRAYGTCFLTPDELATLGIDGRGGRSC